MSPDVLDMQLKYSGDKMNWRSGVTQHAMLDAFLKEYRRDFPGYKPPAHVKTQWERASERLAASLRAHSIRETDWPAFVHSACRYNRQRMLSIKGPQSLEHYVGKFKGAAEDTGKYRLPEDYYEAE